MRTVTLLAAIALTLPLGAQEGSVSGTVRDSTGNLVAGATITVPALERQTRTDSEGRFMLASLPDGRLVLVASAAGFETSRATIVVSAGTGIEVRFTLARRRTDLAPVLVRERLPAGTSRPAPDLLGTIVAAGARSEVVTLDGSDANLAEKVGRQIFARVPGIQVYDMDGAGNQTNVSTRGLDPHRSWELNVRQDGVSMNSDVYGYPATHYSPPMEAIQELQLVRGTAALQYGSQFGGLLNYITRRPDTSRPFSSSASVTTGSFSLLNAFGEIGGRIGKVEYQAYGAWRESDGFRSAVRSRYNAQYLAATWRASDEFSLRAQVGRSWYLYRIPGPLTDAMFESDARTATRTRNWFSPTITIPALLAEWEPRPGLRISAQLSAVVGDRSSVQFVGFATVPDVPDGTTGLWPTRAVDIDDFDSKTAEIRLVGEHHYGSILATLAAGVTLADNDMRRRQQGTGSRGSDYDLTISGVFGRDLHYRSRSFAAYAEDAIRLTPRWTVIPGVRIERGRTDMEGRLAYYDPADVPRRVQHDFPLLGLRTEVALAQGREFYAGWSEAYRPMLLKDLLPENALEVSDPGMRDARGWTAEAGLRGLLKSRIRFDVGAFLMRYDGRFGAFLRDDGSGPYLFKTNVGSTRTLGLEATLEAPLAVTGTGAVRGFVATSLFNAIYREGIAVSSGTNVSLEGNAVEGVPRAIIRTGLSYDREGSTLSLQVSHTTRSFGDPLNTVAPSANGARGLVPAYTILDAFGSMRLFERVRARLTVSNLLDARYFTKRPAFYPGPGVWPSDGRSLQLGLVIGR